ncbi:MAG: histidine triad nucleotide-binding protein [Clostridia bacterium]|nr:histidine triad nucleotide-binding protein [Clostridia bacterium]
MDCIFCMIRDGKIPSSKVFENDKVLAFKDLHPQAKVHVLVIPKTHIASCDEISPLNSDCVKAVFEAIPEVAAGLGLDKGYRVVTNCGEHGCQSVKHLHFHILGGEQLADKMS